ncbi:MAG: penicillin-binding protein activator, partial [Bdellovibrionales bacterium]|nr:penicillin-binding protein activator [Bdellovibrionales bacterium]
MRKYFSSRFIDSSHRSFLFYAQLALLLILSACSREPTQYPYTTQNVDVYRPVSTSPQRISRYPWETWQAERALNGELLRNPLILQGDSLLEQGRRKEALEYYEKSRVPGMAYEDRESATIRIAGCQLALDNSDLALATVSEFFRTVNRDVKDVDERFSLVFGFAYGRKGQIGQSLAWFSKAYRLTGGAGPLSAGADRGVRGLLRTQPEAELLKLQTDWAQDSFIASRISQERRRRVVEGVKPVTDTLRPFWELDGVVTANNGVDIGDPLGVIGSMKIGILLPMSGRYQNLGKSTERGIRLAFEAYSETKGIPLLVRDTRGEVGGALDGLQSLVVTDRVSVIMGPLLSDLAAVVVPRVEKSGIPIITFSKREDLKTGGDVFRLGPTAESQVHSLLEVCENQYGYERYGILYPDNSSGAEFANAFRKGVIGIGRELVFEGSYSPTDSTQNHYWAAEIERQNLDAIFFPDGPNEASKFFVNMSATFRSKVRVLGPASWDNPAVLARSRNILNGAVFVSPFFERSDRQIVREFVTAYRNKYGVDPDFLSAQGFDAGTM